MHNLNDIQKLPQSEKIKLHNLDLIKTISEEENKPFNDRKINISFLFFNRKNPLFNLGEIRDGWYLVFLDAIKDLSNITKKQLFSGEYRSTYKPHDYITYIDKLNYKEPLLLNEQYEGCQLRLRKSFGRIHGFFIENVYYIVYLDHNHNMYDSEGYEKCKELSEPKTEYELLSEEYSELLEKLVKSEQFYYKVDKFISKNCIDCDKAENLFYGKK